jgi:coproporphyrinogen III oxidase-like Fe-S oxidoreductase
LTNERFIHNIYLYQGGLGLKPILGIGLLATGTKNFVYRLYNIKYLPTMGKHKLVLVTRTSLLWP